VRDLAQAAGYDPDEPYVALWLFLAQRRSGSEGTALARSFASEAWPRPAIELLLGRMTPEALRTAARDYGERCEADFYIGSWQLLRGDPAARERSRPPPRPVRTSSSSAPGRARRYSAAARRERCYPR
jgi:hypothetical protein